MCIVRIRNFSDCMITNFVQLTEIGTIVVKITLIKPEYYITRLIWPYRWIINDSNKV
jgi:hypothetical protein